MAATATVLRSSGELPRLPAGLQSAEPGCGCDRRRQQARQRWLVAGAAFLSGTAAPGPPPLCRRVQDSARAKAAIHGRTMPAITGARQLIAGFKEPRPGH